MDSMLLRNPGVNMDVYYRVTIRTGRLHIVESFARSTSNPNFNSDHSTKPLPNDGIVNRLVQRGEKHYHIQAWKRDGKPGGLEGLKQNYAYRQEAFMEVQDNANKIVHNSAFTVEAGVRL